MEPWSERKKRHEQKSLGQKVVEAAVVIYAGFAICVLGALAEGVTIPLAARIKNRIKRRRDESS